MTLGIMPNFNLVYLTVLEITVVKRKNNSGETMRVRTHLSNCVFLVLVYRMKSYGSHY